MSDPIESLEEIISICNNKDRKGYLTVAILKDTGEVIGTCSLGSTNKKVSGDGDFTARDFFIAVG